MIQAALRRGALSVFILFLVSVLVFVATEVLPGDALEVSLRAEDFAVLTAEQVDAMRRELGLDRPAAVRYLTWISGAVQGDFGLTFINRTPVADLIWTPLRNSAILAAAITLIAIPSALFIGVVTAYWRGRTGDAVVSTTAIVGYSMPDFVIGSLLIIVFAVWIPLFPAVITVFATAPARELWAIVLLPAMTVIIGHVAHLGRLLRAGMIETLNSDFVERARLSGVPEWRLIFRHALPASVIPTLNAMALFVAHLVSGVVVIEKVFGYPGLGIVLIEAVHNREVAIVQAIAFIAAVAVVTMNLLADLAVIALDPRQRRG